MTADLQDLRGPGFVAAASIQGSGDQQLLGESQCRNLAAFQYRRGRPGGRGLKLLRQIGQPRIKAIISGM